MAAQIMMFRTMLERSIVAIIISIVVAILLFLGVVLYRLFLSPISKFPGPKLAAATYLYEGYYDIVKRGKYTFKIRDLHAKYGLLTFSQEVALDKLTNMRIQVQ